MPDAVFPAADVVFRPATVADVPVMTAARLTDAEGPADPRMAAYLAGTHHPSGALAPRTAFLGARGGTVIGYIAGHLTRRHGCEGEVQYLYVAPPDRRQKVGTGLLLRLAAWFAEQSAFRVCVNVNPDSPAARPFYAHHGATDLQPLWLVWSDVRMIGDQRP